jgi:hypothetical protein
VSNITLPRAEAEQIRAALVSGEKLFAALFALDAAIAEPDAKREFATDALRRWANANDDAPEIDFQRGYDAARRWVREVALPWLAEPEPVVVEQLFALAKLTVRRAADPDPWVWDRLADDGTWTPFNPLIHGPDMWRLEQAIRAALAEPEQKPEPVAWRTFDGEYDYEYRGYKYNENYAAEWLERNPGYVGWVEPLYTAPPAAAKREPATDEQVTEAYISPDIDGRWRDFELGFRAAERFHGIGGSK